MTQPLLASYQDLVNRYGEPYKSDADRVAFEHAWLDVWKASAFSQNKGMDWPVSMPFTNIFTNKDLIPMLDAVFADLISGGLIGEITSYAGSYNIRAIRGSDPTTQRWSIHSWALAIDLNADKNPLGGPVTWSDGFVQIWRNNGFVWGGDFHRVDGMHFQLPKGF